MTANLLNFDPNEFTFGLPTPGASPTESGGSQTLSVTQISGDPVKFLVAIAIIIVVTLLSGDYWWIADILLIAAYGAEEKSHTVTNMFQTFTNWIGG